MLADKALMLNLAKVALLWCVTSFVFYLKGFLMKYFPGSVFLNSTVSSLAEAAAPITALMLSRHMNKRRLLSVFYLFTTIGAFPLLYSAADTTDFYRERIVPGCVLLVSFGLTGTWFGLFLSHLEVFPVVFAGTTMGVCNIAARFCTIWAPLFAELPEPVPQNAMFALSLGATILSFSVKEKTKSFY